MNVCKMSNDKVAYTSNVYCFIFSCFLNWWKWQILVTLPFYFLWQSKLSLRTLVLTVYPALDGFSLKSVGFLLALHIWACLSPTVRLSLTSETKAWNQLLPRQDLLWVSAQHLLSLLLSRPAPSLSHLYLQ